jgi:hypothetical protein
VLELLDELVVLWLAGVQLNYGGRYLDGLVILEFIALLNIVIYFFV